MNKKELMKKAQELNIKGRSKMNVAQLREAVTPKEPKKIMMYASKKDPEPVSMVQEPLVLEQQASPKVEAEDKRFNQVRWCLILLAGDLKYTQQITHYGCEMDCANEGCGNTGWTTHHPHNGMCYWCNKEGRKFDKGEESQVVVKTPKQINWWVTQLEKARTFLTRSCHDQKLKLPEVLLDKCGNACGIVTRELARLEEVKTGIRA